jgi:hypothetical protein
MKQKLILFAAVLIYSMQGFAQTAGIYNNGAHIVSQTEI